MTLVEDAGTSEEVAPKLEFLDLLQIQGNSNMVTKSELLHEVRESGHSISDRQLTTYISEGLVPKSARIGSRAGAFPAIVVDLVCFITGARKRGVSVPSIRECLPVWRFMKQAVLQESLLDLAELEYVVRQHALSPEAAFVMPWLVQGAIGACPNCTRDFKVRYRDGEERKLGDGDPATIFFVMAELDEEDETMGYPVASMGIVLPRPVSETEKTRVTIGVPNGVTVVELDPNNCEEDSDLDSA